MLLALLVAAALAPGACTVWLLRRRGWGIAVLAGAGVTLALPFVLISSLIVFPPLAILAAVGCAVSALNAYNDGRIVMGAGWMAFAGVCTWCAGWPI
ncbi:hypothetical protein OHA71_23715 [Streptomyces sp. NBC_00444]|uniref:hypothetical protein n=1 Tax=Streptomyces sp. NBC_00444 TaxID=2975744 RepID=UPI002E244F0B